METYDVFGVSVALAGETLVGTEPSEDSAADSGAVYFYRAP